jgi:phosphonate utilization transcriptional regulator
MLGDYHAVSRRAWHFVDNLQKLSYDPFPMKPAPHLNGNSSSAIDTVRGNSLASLTQREIERMIVTGELAAGARLNSAEIAEGLGVSRAPVREAIRALDEAGLVRVEKNRGIFVREVTLEEADAIYEVRAALEGLIGRLAARRIVAKEVEQLRGVVRRMAAIDHARKPEAYYPLNVAFHDRLLTAARNRPLAIHYRRVVNELDLYRRETISRIHEHIPISTREHHAIVEAVAAGDANRAERLLYNHVIQSRERLHKALRTPLAARESSGAARVLGRRAATLNETKGKPRA